MFVCLLPAAMFLVVIPFEIYVQKATGFDEDRAGGSMFCFMAPLALWGLTFAILDLRRPRAWRAVGIAVLANIGLMVGIMLAVHLVFIYRLFRNV